MLVWDVFFSLDIPDRERTLWVVDVSSSMGIEDIATNNQNVMMSRLDLAKSIMSTSFSGETAIMIYARHANMILPFTSDIDQARRYTAWIQGVQAYGWSSITSAFDLIGILYGKGTIPLHIILISDGWNVSESLEMRYLPSFSRLSVIGIGSKEGGMIPLGYNALGERRYKMYQWEHIRVPIDQKYLESIAERYGAPLEIVHTQSEWVKSMERILPIQNTQTKKQYPSLPLVLASLSIMIGYMISPYKYVLLAPK